MQYRFQYLTAMLVALRLGSDQTSTLTTQARLHCTQFTRIQVLSQAVVPSSTKKSSPQSLGLHGSWVSPHAIEDSPSTLTPSISPKLGVRSQHQKLHRYALNGFLAPSSNKDLLTRIPHHLLFILYRFYSLFARAKLLKTSYRVNNYQFVHKSKKKETDFAHFEVCFFNFL